MRLLAGKLKGRAIVVPSGIRPVSQRVSMACFDILRPLVPEESVLDLFCGSGSLGLEALSQGAGQCLFVDWQKSSIAAVKENILSLGIGEKAKTWLSDVFPAIKDLSRQKRQFGLIFLDPPYYKGILIKALQALEEYDILTPSGYLVSFSYLKDASFTGSGEFSLIEDKKYGQTSVKIYTQRQ